MVRNLILIALMLIILVLGIGRLHKVDPNAPKSAQTEVQLMEDARFTVTRVQIIHDDLAYENKRGAYVIVDNKTGKEYIGISGIGLTEVGSHTVRQGNYSHQVQHEQ